MQAIVKGRTSLAPGMRKVTDWVGCTVELAREVRNGWAVATVGTRARVTYARGGLTLETDACKCCGLALRVTRVPPHCVRLIERPAREGGA